MSLILDALKRAERERQPGPAGALDDRPGGQPPGGPRRWLRRVALGVLALVVIAVAVSVMRRPRPTAPAPVEQARAPAPAAQPLPAPRPQPQPQSRQQATPPASAPAPSEVPLPARPAPSVIPGTEGVSTLDELTPDTDLDLEPAAPPAAAEPAARPPQVDAPARPAEPAGAPADEPAAQGDAAEPATPPQAAPAPENRPAIPQALTQKAPVRRLREMPPDYRADFPALALEVHVFEPRRRFVMINGRRYKEGERIAEGPQILEIVRDGVVFEYRGEKVLFPLSR